MLFTGWEVRIVKNCDRGLENAARGRRPRAAYKKTKHCFNFCKHKDKISRKRYRGPVGRYRRILPALTTNQNAGFVTVPSKKKKIKNFINQIVNLLLYYTSYKLYNVMYMVNIHVTYTIQTVYGKQNVQEVFSLSSLAHGNNSCILYSICFKH